MLQLACFKRSNSLNKRGEAAVSRRLVQTEQQTRILGRLVIMASPPGPLAGVVVPPVVVPPVAARSPGSAHVDGGNSWWDSVLSNFGEGGHTSLSAEPRGNDGVPLLLESPHDVGAVASQCPTGLALLNAPTATCGAGGENAFPQAGTSTVRCATCNVGRRFSKKNGVRSVKTRQRKRCAAAPRGRRGQGASRPARPG